MMIFFLYLECLCIPFSNVGNNVKLIEDFQLKGCCPTVNSEWQGETFDSKAVDVFISGQAFNY